MARMQIINKYIFSTQVCAEESATDQEIEEYVNCVLPTGLDSKWVIRKQGDTVLEGDPERQPCEDKSGWVHVMLDCGT